MIDVVGEGLKVGDIVRVYSDPATPIVRRVISLGQELGESVVRFKGDTWAFARAVQKVETFFTMVEHYLENGDPASAIDCFLEGD